MAYDNTFIAFRSGNLEGIRNCVERGVDVNVQDSNGHSLLYWSTLLPGVDVLKTLLSKGAKPNEFDKHHQVPLHKSAMRGRTDMVEILLTGGAAMDFVDSFGRTALHWACCNGHDEVAFLLIDRGCDSSILDKGGYKAADIAMEKGHVSITDYIAHHGCISSARYHDKSWTASQSSVEHEQPSTTPESPSDLVTPFPAKRLPLLVKMSSKTPRERALLWEELMVGPLDHSQTVKTHRKHRTDSVPSIRPTQMRSHPSSL